MLFGGFGSRYFRSNQFGFETPVTVPALTRAGQEAVQTDTHTEKNILFKNVLDHLDHLDHLDQPLKSLGFFGPAITSILGPLGPHRLFFARLIRVPPHRNIDNVVECRPACSKLWKKSLPNPWTVPSRPIVRNNPRTHPAKLPPK